MIREDVLSEGEEMYEVYRIQANGKFKEVEGREQFMFEQPCADAARQQSEGIPGAVFAVIEDGYSIPSSVFWNGREFLKVEIDI